MTIYDQSVAIFFGLWLEPLQPTVAASHDVTHDSEAEL